MKADKIIKNAKIYTSDRFKPIASAMAVKDGKFVYVGDEAGLADYEGEVTDLGGKFIMPGIIDSHLHITSGVAFEYAEMGEVITIDGKQAILDFIADYIQNHPGLERYRFKLEKKRLRGENLAKEDLDAICQGAEIQILEGENHSTWVNSKILEKHGITDESPDPVRARMDMLPEILWRLLRRCQSFLTVRWIIPMSRLMQRFKGGLILV